MSGIADMSKNIANENDIRFLREYIYLSLHLIYASHSCLVRIYSPANEELKS